MAESSPSKKPLPSEKKVMVVDDDDTIVSLFRTCLEIEGFQVKTARDGRNIVAVALQYKPDLIISDLMMPAGGGYELIRSLQSDALTRGIPIILITGSQLDSSTKEMMQRESNLVAYLEKPIRPEKLLAKVHSTLNTMSLTDRHKAEKKDFPTSYNDVF